MAFDTPDRPCLTLFAGPNGAGKTTAYRRFVDAGFEAGDYLNPDDIAGSIETVPGQTVVDVKAGREVIRRTRSLIAARQSFARETTLSGREVLHSVSAARDAGYRVVMVFVGTCSTKTTRSRVTVRVVSGGHDISRQAQERRLPRSLDNARRVAAIADVVYFLDNTGLQHKLVATVCEGTITFLDASRVVHGSTHPPMGGTPTLPYASAVGEASLAEGSWLDRATAGLPRAPSLCSREEALSRLREAERLSDSLRVREGRPAYLA